MSVSGQEAGAEVHELVRRLQAREAELALIHRIAGIGGVEVDLRDGFRNRRSPEYLAIHGLSPAAANKFHEDWVARIHPDDRVRTEKQFRDALEGTELNYSAEYRIIRPDDGRARWVRVAAQIDRDSNGRPIRLIGAHFDVTDSKLSVDILRESEERFRSIANSAPIPMWVTKLNGERAFVNQAYSDFFGLRPEEALTLDWRTRVHPEDADHIMEAEQLRSVVPFTVSPSDNPLSIEFRIRAKDGWRWISAVSQPRFDEHGQHVGFIGVAHDITAAKQAEIELRASEERLRLAVENAEVGFWDVDLVNDKLIWPPRTKALFGISSNVPVTMADFYNGLHVDDREVTSRAFAKAAEPAQRALYDVEYRTIGKEDGIVRWVAAKGRGVFDIAGRCLRVAGTAIDITARKKAEAALQESEERLRHLNATLEHRVAETLSERRLLADVIDGSDVLVQVADPDFNWLAINRAAATEFARIFGVRRPKVGDNMLKLLEHRPSDRAAVEAVWSRALGGEEFVEVNEFGDPSYDRRYYEMRFRLLKDAAGKAIGAYQFVSDVTERLREQARLRDTEEALRQSQKMDAMGSLTGGVAHDFNNLLTPIVGVLDILQRKGLGGDRERRLIDGAVSSAERAKVLVQRLLAFARRQPLQAVAVDVSALVRNMADLVSSTIGPQIKVVVDAENGLPAAKADPNQIEMALLNLAVNARDAMPDGGTLRISASASAINAGQNGKLRPGRYICLSVADTGIGMDESTLARAVEPFFSTKGVGKGTGLGLSMVHGLASQLGGELRIKSRVGLGTNVELWLLQTDETPDGPMVMDHPEVIDGRGTALLVDDEEIVRLSTADMLVDLGYRVVEAASAEEALAIIRGGAHFDLVVTDHLMPGITGTDLAREVRERRPDLPVLIISGYAELDSILPDLARLTKPFRKDELAASLVALALKALNN